MESQAPAEWNAGAYHRLSDPMVDFGRRVLARLDLDGDERVLDAGCGTGRLTASLADRLPGGLVVGLDRSRNMIDEAVARLRDRRFAGIHAALPDLPFDATLDVVFSTATFHWVLDHPALFAAIFRALRPGGRLLAQCGGGPNLTRFHERAEALMGAEPFAPSFAAFTPHWHFADAATTAARLEHAGFAAIESWLEETPVTLDDATTYHDYLTTVIMRGHLAYLPEALRHPFIARLTRQAAGDPVPFRLDYWRLNMFAVKPA